jgi:hypothetical protein
MAADAVIAGVQLTPAAPDTASDVGAVHHDVSPDVSGIFDPDCCFFVSADQQISRRDLETEIPGLKTDILHTRCR